MSSFWPEGLEISDIQSPRDILNTANEEWLKNSNGILELVLQDAESKSGNSMIIVHAKHVVNNRTSQLFSIVYQPGKPYPVTIQPEKEELPDFLKKSVEKQNVQGEFGLKGISNLSLLTEIQKGQRFVFNHWVSDTPSEFRTKLSEAFNLGIIKREILNLASSTTNNVNNTNEDLDLSEEDV
jgi:hypothetical protein